MKSPLLGEKILFKSRLRHIEDEIEEESRLRADLFTRFQSYRARSSTVYKLLRVTVEDDST